MPLSAQTRSTTTGKVSYARPQRCNWPGCRAVLAHDHGSPVCSCHVARYRLEHDRNGNELVLHLLLSAYPDAVDLTVVLHATPEAVKNRVRYLRRRGYAITGLAHGYRLELPVLPAPQARLKRLTIMA